MLLPSDYAISFGYSPALGTEPYLPTFISPRFCTYQSIVLGVYITVVIPYPFSQALTPNSVVISGVTYQLQSTIGEQRGLSAAPNVILCSGPQGPTGPAGPALGINVVHGHLSNSQLLALIGTPLTLVNAPGAGLQVQPLWLTYNFNYATPTGTTGATVAVGQAPVQQMAFPSTVFTATSSRYGVLLPSGSPFTITCENIPIQLFNPTTAVNCGGSLDYALGYQTVSLP